MLKNNLYLLLIGSLLFSCIDKGSKYYGIGKKKYQEEEFHFAIENLQQSLSYGIKSTAEANYMIAEAYRLSNRLGEAEKFYKIALDEGIEEENAMFYYAFAMKANGKYLSAKKQLQKYQKFGTNFGFLNRAKHEIRNLKELSKISRRPRLFKIENCAELNTGAVEYSPVLFKKNKMYFTSSRGEGVTYPGQGTRFTDVFEYRFDGFSLCSGVGRPIGKEINQHKTHEASATFTDNYRTMVFSRSNTGRTKDETKEVDLFVSHSTGGFWAEPERLVINEKWAWDSNPSLSSDGKTLYFSSNREGGYGGDDIWKAVWSDSAKTWLNPENMGAKINTEGNEQFPYERYDGKFFFASDGIPGFGGLDVFMITNDDKGKEVTWNLGKPINSGGDDFAIIYKNDTTGYFTSNRTGGKGDDDIYSFGYQVETVDIDYLLTGIIYGKTLDRKGNITNNEIILANSKVVLTDTVGNLLGVDTTDAKGRFRFSAKPELVYHLKVTHSGYLMNEKDYSTVGKTILKEKIPFQQGPVLFKTNLTLTPVVAGMLVDFPPIYYEYARWEITEASHYTLEAMEKVLNDNPNIKVEIGAHTDPRNTVEYNDILSQKRAESVVSHMVKSGIDPKRLIAKGYGERIPYLMKNDTLGIKKGDVLTHTYIEAIKDAKLKSLAYQLDRRTEFKIVGFVDGGLDTGKDIEVIKHGEKDEIIEEEKIKYQELIIKKHFGDEQDKEIEEIEEIEEE
jgi:peptidoglycan-associated lipoprotein